jgi:protein Mpv17
MSSLSLAAARVYQHSFEHHPNYTLAITGGTLNAIGDIVAQSVQLSVRFHRLIELMCVLNEIQSRLDDREAKYDVPRTFRFFIYGVGISMYSPFFLRPASTIATLGPFLGRWNHFLETKFPLRSIGGKVSLPALSKRVAADQLIMSVFPHFPYLSIHF